MRKIRYISLMLILSLMTSMLPMPVGAEGYSYDFESNSKALFMFNLDSGATVYSMNADEELPMASLTKIMTYIVAYENIPDIENTIVTVDQSVEDNLKGTGSSMAGINVGEKLTVLQLLNMMMIPSGNDAALALATYVDQQAAAGTLQIGVNKPVTSSSSEDSSSAENSSSNSENSEGSASIDSTAEDSTSSDSTTDSSGSVFVDLMNQKARELGCLNTHFVNPHGLYDPNHYTTARDMAKIAKYATTLPYFTQITSSVSYTLPATNIVNEERTVYSTNKMFSQSSENEDYYYTYANGIKTGSLDESGYCIVSSATYEGYTYIVVALGSPMVDKDGNTIDYHGEMVDARTLFRWAFLNLSMKNIAEKGDLLGEVSLKYAWNTDSLQVVAGDNVSAILPNDVSVSSIIVDVDLPESVQAPVKKGDKLGTATFSYANEEIATVDLVASESVERSEVIQTIETGKEVVSSPWFLIIATAIIIILIVYIIIIMLYNRKRKKMRRVKKYRDL